MLPTEPKRVASAALNQVRVVSQEQSSSDQTDSLKNLRGDANRRNRVFLFRFGQSWTTDQGKTHAIY